MKAEVLGLSYVILLTIIETRIRIFSTPFVYQIYSTAGL